MTNNKFSKFLTTFIATTGSIGLSLLIGSGAIYLFESMSVAQTTQTQIVDASSYRILVSSKDNAGTQYDITLSSVIDSVDAYRDVIQVLQHATKQDTVIFHLAGYGGEVEAIESLIDNVKHTQAYVIMSVEAPVYSAHAYFAGFGNELRVAPFAYLMYHFSSVLNEDCDSKTGTDRGVSNKEHCEALKSMEIYNTTKMLMEIKFLTPAEIQLLLTGHDVYLSHEELLKRGAIHE